MDAETSLGYFKGLAETVIDALIAARLDGAVLELSGDEPEAFEELIATISSAHPELAEANRRASEAFKIGPVSFGIGPHLIPIDGDNLERLRAIAFGFVTHLSVRDDDGVLVYTHDVGDGEIWVSDRLPHDAVERMRAVLGDGLRPATRD